MEDMNIYDKLNTYFYKVTAEYPARVSRKCPECHVIFDKDANFCQTCGYKVHEYYKEQKKKQEEMLTLYRQEEADKHNLFMKDTLDEVGLSDHPKAHEIFSYAWEKGHSSGYSEVFNELQDLSGLFK